MLRVNQLSRLVLFLFIFSLGSYAQTSNIATKTTTISGPTPVFFVVLNRARSHEQLDLTQVKRIFSLRSLSWPDEKAIQLVTYPDSNPIHVEFSKKILGVFPYQLRKHWDRQIYTGAAPAPTQVKSEQAMLSLLASKPDAIAYSDKEISNEFVYSVQILP